MVREVRWKCHNCGDEFVSQSGCERDEFEIHSSECFDIFDFFEILEDSEVKPNSSHN